jgi:hypothetical protein
MRSERRVANRRAWTLDTLDLVYLKVVSHPNRNSKLQNPQRVGDLRSAFSSLSKRFLLGVG